MKGENQSAPSHTPERELRIVYPSFSQIASHSRNLLKNSSFLAVLSSMPISWLVASRVRPCDKIRRTIATPSHSSGVSSSSSCRVPDFARSIAGKHPRLRQCAVELNLRVARPLEFLKDDIVHAASGFHQNRRDDGQASAFFEIPRRTEKAFGLVQRARAPSRRSSPDRQGSSRCRRVPAGSGCPSARRRFSPARPVFVRVHKPNRRCGRDFPAANQMSNDKPAREWSV